MTTIIDGTSGITFPEGNNQKGALTLATAKATTSGTYVDFTGIPSWAKRITVMFNGVSTSGTSNPLVQLGTSSGVQTSGYLAGSSNIAGTVATAGYTTGFGVNSASAAVLMSGSIIFTQIENNRYIAQGIMAMTTGSNTFTVAGNSPTLSGTLDRIRITTVNGTDLFDAGSVNIMYE
jgi:hypothetical protein